MLGQLGRSQGAERGRVEPSEPCVTVTPDTPVRPEQPALDERAGLCEEPVGTAGQMRGLGSAQRAPLDLTGSSGEGGPSNRVGAPSERGVNGLQAALYGEASPASVKGSAQPPVATPLNLLPRPPFQVNPPPKSEASPQDSEGLSEGGGSGSRLDPGEGWSPADR